VTRGSDHRLSQRLINGVWRAIEDAHQADGGRVRAFPALFPVLQRTDVEAEQVGVFALRQSAVCAHFSDVDERSRNGTLLAQLHVQGGEVASERAHVLGLRHGANRPSQRRQFVDRLVGLF